MADQKQELLRMLKGKSVKRYHFSLQEDENQPRTTIPEAQGLKPSSNACKTSVASVAENYSVRQTGLANLSSRRSPVA
jgi:shikimate kinase